MLHTYISEDPLRNAIKALILISKKIWIWLFKTLKKKIDILIESRKGALDRFI